MFTIKIIITSGIILLSSNKLLGNEFAIEKDLPPLKQNTEDFVKLLNSVHHLIMKYDSSYVDGEMNIEVEYENTTESFSSINLLRELPLENIYKLNFQFSNYHGSIKNLTIDLNDSRRRIRVVGEDYVELQTIMNHLESILLENKIYFGGPMFRYVLWIFLFIISSILFLNIRFKISPDRRIGIYKGKNGLLTILGGIVFGLTILSSWGLINFQFIFSGFVLFKTNASFIDKYANYFTFWGFILTLLTFVGFDLYKSKKSQKDVKTH
jgi:hypothetical protein